MPNYSNSKKITIWQLHKWGYFSHSPQGIITWPENGIWSKPDNLIQGKIALKVELQKSYINVGYVVQNTDDSKKRFNFPIYLEHQKCYFGGFRLFMICPLIANGIPCKRRTTVLYKPDGSPFLGCRVCHKIRYSSQILNQKYRKNTDYLKMILDKKILSLEEQIKKKHYKSKLTKKQAQLNKLYKKVGLNELTYDQ